MVMILLLVNAPIVTLTDGGVVARAQTPDVFAEMSGLAA
jgi:hypothetical protein